MPDAGNSLNAATQLSPTTTQQTFTDTFSSQESDYFRLDLNRPSSVSLSLTALTGNASLQLLDSNGQGLVTVDNGNALAETLVQTLDAGSYYVRVLPATSGDSGDYTLSYAAKAQDTQVDVFWREAGGTNAIWQMGGVNNATVEGGSTVDLLTSNWQIAAIADFNQDSNPDIFWRETSQGINAIWYMGGADNNAIIGTQLLTSLSANWEVGGVADFDRNGTQDIVWRETTQGLNAIWLMGGANGTTIEQGINLDPVTTNWKIVGVTDFDGDQNLDILWRENTQGINAFWRLGGPGGTTFLEGIALPTLAPNWQLVGTVDFNGDQRSDLMWRETTDGTNAVWFMGGANNATIEGSTVLTAVSSNWTPKAYSWSDRAPVDLAGNTAATAFAIGTLDGTATYDGFVGGADAADDYTFTVAARSTVSLNLAARADVNLVLFDSNGNEVSSSTNAGNQPDSIQTILSAGTYRARVIAAEPVFGGTNYSLSLTGAVIPPPVVSIGASDATAAEVNTGQTANPGLFTITRTGDDALPITVVYTISGTATNGTDYTTISNSVTLAAGETSKDIPINITNDSTIEGDETVILTLGTGTGYVIGANNTATVTVNDNDLPVISVNIPDSSLGETAAGQTANPGSFSITRTGPTTQALTVNYGLTGTATNGVDYQQLTNSVTIPVGQTSVTIPVNVIDDTDFEGNETIILTLSTGNGYTLGTATRTLSITENDKPTVTLGVPDAAAAETNTGQTANPGQFTVFRTGATTSSLTVNYTVTGTAVKGTDYNNLSGSVAIAAGQSSATIPINVTNDALVEGNETVILTLNTNTNYNIGTNGTGTVIIADNDDGSGNTPATARDIGSLSSLQSFNDRVDVNDPDDYYKFTVAQTTAFVARLKNLTDDVDLALFDASLTLIAGSFNSGTLDEQILTEVGPGTYYLRVLPNAPAESNYTLDVVEVPKVTVTAIDANALETTNGESPDPGAFTITRTGPTTQALTVNYSLDGSATNGTDYANLTGSVVIPVGQSSVTVPINVIDDTVEEGNETVIINLGNSSAYYVGNTDSGTVTIADNDLPLPDLKASNLSITRGTFEKGSDFAIRFNLGNNTAYSAGSFNVGVYLSTDSTITTADRFLQAIDIPGLAANENPSVGLGTILLPNVNDSFWQASNTYYVGLIVDPQNSVTELRENNNSNQGIGSDILEITVTEPPPTVSISATKAQASEVNDSIGEIKIPGEFTISRSGGIAEALTVNYTVSGTATSGSDYTSLSGTVTIPVGQTSVKIPVNVIDDTTQETSETVIVSLASSANYSLGNSSSTVNIADNDASLSDLRIAGIKTGTGGTTFTPGQQIDLQYAILNRTTYSVPNTFRVDYYLSTDANITTGDRLIGSRTISYGINANSTVGEGSLLNLPAAGDSFWQAGTTYYLGTVLDAGSSVTEANEVNNVNQGVGVDILQFTVTSPA